MEHREDPATSVLAIQRVRVLVVDRQDDIENLLATAGYDVEVTGDASQRTDTTSWSRI